MTSVKVTRQDDHIISVECSGHTGYAERGEDIVCAALSSVVQTALLGLTAVAGIRVKCERRDEEGYIKFQVENLKLQERRDADMILGTMLAGVTDLYQGYSDFIELEVN
jgi:uncharacterized protein YsxB (DUF464 family)